MNNSTDLGEYGEIAGNSSINQCIYRCFDYICKEVMHIFRELILGAYLGFNNFKIRYEFKIKDLSPDCLL